MAHMLRGCLRLIVLKALSEGEKSGYDLMKYVEEKLGDKPSSGSMYPLLDKLKEEGYVTVKKSGRKNLYKLTSSGKERSKQIEGKRQEILGSFNDGMKVLEALTGESLSIHQQMIERMKKGEMPLKELNPELNKWREQLIRLWKKGDTVKKADQIKAILAKTTKELKKL